jgi:putative transposase
MKRKRKHSKAEIAAKLAQADNLAVQGKLQTEIADALGVSVMTLHRWRKLPASSHSEPPPPVQPKQFEQELGQSQRFADIQLENCRLRELVIDLLLEKIKLEKALQSRNSPGRGSQQAY